MEERYCKNKPHQERFPFAQASMTKLSG